MTCVIGYVDKQSNSIWMGADSAGTNGSWSQRIRLDQKVFIRDEMIFGFTSSFRMGQLLRYKLVIPERKENEGDFRYLAGAFMDSVIECLKDNNFATIKDNEISGGFFLLGYRGHLYQIESDFQIGLGEDLYDAVGCGEEYALGHLKATEKLKIPIKKKIQQALECSAYYSAGVAEPFIIEELKNT